MKNQRLNKSNILTILSILGYTIMAAVVVMVGYVVSGGLKNNQEASFTLKQNDADVPLIQSL